MPRDERPAKTMFVITTDGQENSSHEYTYNSIKRLVQRKQEKDRWEFIFLGANMDAISAAADIGIRADRASNYCCDSLGTAVNYKALSKVITEYRCADLVHAVDMIDGWDADVVADYNARYKENKTCQ